MLRWLPRLLAIGLVLALAGSAYVYARSAWVIAARYRPPIDGVPVPRDPAGIAEGARLYRIMTCGTCHGADGRGQVMFEGGLVGRLVAPGLARAAVDKSDKDLVRAIRYGVHPDGRSLFLMPVARSAGLADEDLGRIIGWIRTLRPQPRDLAPEARFGPVGRLMILSGDLPLVAHTAAVTQPRRPPDTGRYLVETSCLTCHEMTAANRLADGTMVPPLALPVSKYDAGEFRRLIRAGISLDEVRLPMTAALARNNYAGLTDAEIAAIFGYLQAQGSPKL